MRWQTKRVNGSAIIVASQGILQENAAFQKGKEMLEVETAEIAGMAKIQAIEKVIRAEN
jgi:hypothetical protein